MKKEIFVLLIVFLSLGCSNGRIKKSNETSDIVYNGAFLGSTNLINNEINRGLNIDNHYVQEKTLLIEAVRSNNIDTVYQLLISGADIEKKDIHGRTAIFYAPSIEMLELLISNKAKLNVIDNSGNSIMTYFVNYKPNEYLHLLIDSGLYSEKKFSNIKDEKLGFILAEKNNKELIDKMINIDPTIFLSKDKSGNYPIFYEEKSDIILSLLNVKYNLNEENNYGENILGEVYLKSIKNNDLKVIKKLIDKGVDPKYSSYGETPLGIAKKNGNKIIINYLISVDAR
ncbi:ankyrin repeat domain-containing protein [Fusobacterium sp. PH5-44]|uniref:ankyrin repeat domain-containing protein n=1 Tax=unclassified Fusobacterium TaxID=2648384 RepID=UPI003D1A7857